MERHQQRRKITKKLTKGVKEEREMEIKNRLKPWYVEEKYSQDKYRIAKP